MNKEKLIKLINELKLKKGILLKTEKEVKNKFDACFMYVDNNHLLEDYSSEDEIKELFKRTIYYSLESEMITCK